MALELSEKQYNIQEMIRGANHLKAELCVLYKIRHMIPSFTS